ncbi:MAG: hypothetical protein IJL30_07325 [Clostridia bacterium]|nr:hypothetical protein [Clostridia bacterium]
MKSISVEQASNIIQKRISEFLQETEKAINTDDWLLNIRVIPSEFDIFSPASKEFFEYRSLEWKLEWNIRDHLVIGIISDLFNAAEIECQPTKEKQNKAHPTFRYSNADYGENYPFAFIVKTAGETVGYRFSWFERKDEEQIKSILRDHKVDSYRIIDFGYYDSIENEKRVYSRRSDERVSLRSFFEQYFGIEVYNDYISRTRKAVAEASEKNGFYAIPKLSKKHSSDFRITLQDSIREIKLNECSYIKISGERINIDSLAQDDIKIINAYFLDEELYKSLCGDSDFATCFVTAEYLSGIFEKGYLFDYTSVICGYLKSVEQLLYGYYLSFFEKTDLIQGYLDIKKKEIEQLKAKGEFVRENPYKPGAYQKRMDYKKNTPIELGGLVYFLRYEKRAWRVSEEGKESIIRILDDYRKTCRNEHFHKDNIVDYQEVERIRNNTYVCLALILGGFKMMNESISDNSKLGIRNDAYERFYNAIRGILGSPSIFTFQMKDGSIINGYRRSDRRIPKFEYGLVSDMEFIRLNDIKLVREVPPEDELEQKADGLFIINRDNLPIRAWYYHAHDLSKKYELKW